jgi:hypothetical protein
LGSDGIRLAGPTRTVASVEVVPSVVLRAAPG